MVGFFGVSFSVVSFALAGSAAVSTAGRIPTVVGTCELTTVYKLTARLEDGSGKPIPDSGSAIFFANGGSQVSYDQVPAVEFSRPGDQVLFCLVSLPIDCPPGDERGKTYTTTNLRTKQIWTLPDSAHGCGGA